MFNKQKNNLSQIKKQNMFPIKTDFNIQQNAFEIRNWNVWYGTKHALDNITCDIEKNKVTAIIGPNGSGKSALLKSLNRMNRIIYPSVKMSGNIYFFNGTNLYSPIISQSELTTRIGTISQQMSPFPLSIYDNVAYGPRNNGIVNNKILDGIVQNALDDVALWNDVKNKLNDSPNNLSGGQQQCLCIARAIALKPEILLLDQPTGGLDPIATTFIENLIIKLKRKFTIIIISHSMSQTQRISDKTFFMLNGKIIEQGATKQIFMNPKQKATKDFVLGR